MEEKRLKGLCFWCDEKYTLNHMCNNRRLYSITLEAEEVSKDTEGEAEEDVGTVEVETLVVSLHALHGVTMSHKNHTMKVVGYYKRRRLTILIDSGSTHNFLDVGVAKQVGCSIQSIPQKGVMVANGEKMTCVSIVKVFRWQMQGHDYEADVLLMPLKGSEMILGMEWLNSLGKVLWDFTTLTMQYDHGGKSIKLTTGEGEFEKILTGVFSLDSQEMGLLILPV
ncbi:hypothetical protein MLD38_021167 [Melastoma candidum]|uniref:Uncharacterized protein n=1 Tax=Melastoma candidum TaxID=119954 RepID=A0ACB9QNB6_9MYRT|nr:hypothetical protein MLD38_021167 [Melastoma candidum]